MPKKNVRYVQQNQIRYCEHDREAWTSVTSKVIPTASSGISCNWRSRETMNSAPRNFAYDSNKPNKGDRRIGVRQRSKGVLHFLGERLMPALYNVKSVVVHCYCNYTVQNVKGWPPCRLQRRKGGTNVRMWIGTEVRCVRRDCRQLFSLSPPPPSHSPDCSHHSHVPVWQLAHRTPLRMSSLSSTLPVNGAV